MTLAVHAEAGERPRGHAAAPATPRPRRPSEPDRPTRWDAFVPAWEGPLDLLVNNAGIMAMPELARTARGLGAAVRHQPPRSFRAGDRTPRGAGGGGRGAVVSRQLRRAPALAGGLRRYPLRYRPYDPRGVRAVQDGKRSVRGRGDRRWARDGITANALMPGAIATGLQRHLDAGYLDARGRLPLKSPQQGAATSAGFSPPRRSSKESVGATSRTATRPRSARTRVAPYALDPANAERLCDVSLKMLG